MLDGFNAIIMYTVQHQEVANIFHSFLYDYVLDSGLLECVLKNLVYNRDIRTNNYLESFHAALLKLIKPHPKIWEFIGIVIC